MGPDVGQTPRKVTPWGGIGYPTFGRNEISPEVSNIIQKQEKSKTDQNFWDPVAVRRPRTLPLPHKSINRDLK